MSRGFESLADTLIAKGTHPDTIYTKLAEHMDKNGVPMFSFQRYADRPEIVRLFNERGTHATAPDKSAVLAPLLRAAYRPGETPLDGALPGQATNDMLAEALVERDKLTAELATARRTVALEIGGRIDTILRGLPGGKSIGAVAFELGGLVAEYLESTDANQ